MERPPWVSGEIRAEMRFGHTEITHDVGSDGSLAECWDYSGEPAWARVPGSAAGDQVLLLRDWRSALTGLRHRNLRGTPHSCALAGVTFQRDDGLLRRRSSVPRDLINPLWRKDAVTYWRPIIARIAAEHAASIQGAGDVDLVSAFCLPYLWAIITEVAELDGHDEAEMLMSLSDQTTGTLIRSPADRFPVRSAWQRTYEFTHAAILRTRRHGNGLMFRTLRTLESSGMDLGELTDTATTIYTGWPTALPVLVRVLEQALIRHGVMPAVRADKSLAHGVVREGIRVAAHFTFALPGPLAKPLSLGIQTVPSGTMVLPVIHAAHQDPEFQSGLYNIHRRVPGRSLAWGAGMHACLGREVAVIILAEAVKALAERRVELIERPRQWVPGTMPGIRQLLGKVGLAECRCLVKVRSGLRAHSALLTATA